MKRKLLFAMLCIVSALGLNAQTWTAPTITSETPVSGETYKLYNVGAGKYLTEGQAWFGWSTTAILADNGSEFTFTGDASSFVLDTHRSGNTKVFTSGNEIPGDAMHLDGASANNYAYTLMPSGYYHIFDAGSDGSTCWGYEFIEKTGGQATRDSWGVVAHSVANTIGDNGEWAFLTEASFAKFDARLTLYKTLNEAYEKGVSTSSAEVVYNNATATIAEMEEQVVALKVAINVPAVNDAINGETGVDLTSFVENADFEKGNLTAWTSYDGGNTANNGNFSRHKGSWFTEKWTWQSHLSDGSLVHDVVYLPAGVYCITADAQNIEQSNNNVGGTGLFLYANDDKVEIGSAANYTVYTTLAAAGPLTIKFDINNCSGNWVCYDNITLTYFKEGKDIYNIAVAAADAALASDDYAVVTGDERDALVGVKETAPAGSDLLDYQDAAANIYAEIEKFKAAAHSYQVYATYKAETEALFGTDFGVSAPTKSEEAQDAVHNLNIAQYNYVAENYGFSLNGLIGDFGSWTGTATVAGEPATPNYLNWEHWSGKEHAYYEQASNGWGNANGWTIKYEKTCKLPKGKYVLKVAARSSAGTMSKVTCSATPTTIALPAEGASARGITLDGVASWDENDSFAKGNNGVENAGRGWQWRFLPFEITDDDKVEVTMTFFAEATTQYQWMSISDAELLCTEDVTDKVSFDEEKNNSVEDYDIANVTIYRTVHQGYNTMILPFNLGVNQVKEVFGNESEVYNFSENSDDAEKTVVNFKKGDGSINANVPVLVKAPEDKIELVFKGVQVVAPEDEDEIFVEGKNLDFVGSYRTIAKIAAGDYFLNAGKIYKSEGKTGMKAFRAYLRTKSADVRAELFIDGVATAIEAIDADNSVLNGAIYNLAGQRVQKAQRGLYIVNGKKVVIK
jgi:hypothetical protein